jgi:hypothetical protein
MHLLRTVYSTPDDSFHGSDPQKPGAQRRAFQSNFASNERSTRLLAFGNPLQALIAWPALLGPVEVA